MANVEYFMITAQNEKHPSNAKAKETFQTFLDVINTLLGLVHAG